MPWLLVACATQLSALAFRNIDGFTRCAAAGIANHQDFSNWPLIVLVDDARATAKDDMSFLWTAFTRFEPAADIVAAKQEMLRNHISYTPPVVIDARMKPWYPKALECDAETAATVERRWGEYFSPRGSN